MKENLKAGTVLQERYVLEKVIGRGGFGVTYRARDLRVDVPVAVKEYLSQWELSEKEACKFFQKLILLLEIIPKHNRFSRKNPYLK